MKSITGSHDEWVKVNRHLQRVGTATCDVSNMILEADECEKGSRPQFWLMSAARTVLRERQRYRALMAQKINRPRKRIA